MKMKIVDKLLLALSGLVILAGGVVLAGMGLGLIPYTLELVAKTGEQVMDIAWPLVIAGALLVIWGLYFICVPCRMRYNRHNFVVQKTENGELRIAVKAIESLVKRCVDTHDEMHLVSMHIYSKKSTVIITMKISLFNNVSIPLAVASLQKQIKQYLMASSGIEVNDIAVTVDTTNEAVRESPYAVASASQLPRQEEDAVKEKKKPLHQRLFSSKTEEKAKPEVKTEEVQENVQETAKEENPVQDTVNEAETAEVSPQEPQKEIEVNE